MPEYDEVIRWSDLGRPEQPIAIEVDYLGGYVHIEQEHIEAATQLEGDPDVLVRDESDEDDVVKTWSIVCVAPQWKFLR